MKAVESEPKQQRYPSRAEAERLLAEAEPHNPGKWGDHSRIVARCAERIARSCRERGAELDPDKAYVTGLLHDIGRRFGVKHLGHIYDGYTYMMELGYPDAARICLTHSFCIQNIYDYVGKFDIPPEQQKVIEDELGKCVYDDYDRLIQLCDSIGGADGVMRIEDRMNDVRSRYGSYPQEKWDKNLELFRYFEEKAGRDLYEIVDGDL